ncbi:MAG: SRPBCC family protein [Verrucomicrobiota bacterium]
MIRKILIGLAAVIAILLVVIALQPGDFRVERSATLAASPAALFEQVNDHRKFTVWNPWMELDPNVVNTYSGPESGVGAVCSWKGNSNIGAGSSTIIESKPHELVRMRMDWKEPMEGTSTVDFTFKPEGDKTVVTWAMYGPQTFMGKAVSLVMDCEEMCGPQFEKGLASLGKAATQPATLTQTAKP